MQAQDSAVTAARKALHTPPSCLVRKVRLESVTKSRFPCQAALLRHRQGSGFVFADTFVEPTHDQPRDDLFHYQKIVVALKETMRLMEEIDELIPAWPIE
jgi:hypothetical protein